MREIFLAELRSCFVVPAETFDNVKGQFPIGFYIWDTNNKKKFEQITIDCYDSSATLFGTKVITPTNKTETINKWIHSKFDYENQVVCYLRFVPSDFQNNRGVYFTNQPNESDIRESRISKITSKNLSFMCIYLAVRHIVPSDWLNDRDQFQFPKSELETDKEFINDCLAYILFHNQNKVTNQTKTNHFIPFTENEVNSRGEFSSHFMTDYIKGKVARYDDYEDEISTMTDVKPSNVPLVFSQEAQDVFSAGRKLWTYYHKQEDSNPDASFYDIRKHFQGVNDKGKMNTDSEDEEYMRLIGILKERMKVLAKKIEPKVYEYGFLR